MCMLGDRQFRSDEAPNGKHDSPVDSIEHVHQNSAGGPEPLVNHHYVYKWTETHMPVFLFQQGYGSDSKNFS